MLLDNLTCIQCLNTVPDDLYIGSCLIGGFKQFKFTIQNKGGKGRFVLMNKSQWPATNFKVDVICYFEYILSIS